MEQKSLIMSALGVGIGVGVGLGVGRWTAGSGGGGGLTAEKLELELLHQVVDGKDSCVTFEDFPYYLSEQTRAVLTNTAYVHLKQADFSKYTRNLSAASRAILLSGPAELYQQILAKALAHHFEAKLLLLDVTDFSIKIQSKYGRSSKDSLLKRSISEAALDKVSGLFESFSLLPSKEEPKVSVRRQISGVDIRSRNGSSSDDLLQSDSSHSISANSASLKRASSWSFDEKLLLQSVYKVLTSISKTNPVVLYIRNVEDLLFRSQRMYTLFQKMLNKITGRVLIVGSRVVHSESDNKEVDKSITVLFPYNVEIKPPEDETHLQSWISQLEEDMKMIEIQDNKNHIAEVLVANDLECDDLGSVCLADTATLSNYIEEIVISAVSYHLMNNKHPEYRNGKLVISSKSLSHGLSLFQESQSNGKDKLKLEASAEEKKDAGNEEATKSDKNDSDNKNEAEKSTKSKGAEAPPDNEFEKRIRPEVIPANEIGVTFDDIGALGDIKDSLNELVMLPLRRPDLFKGGGLLKPCRGILLFGPPGTGKTMLAKAIAKEAGASFINVSMSTITSKWFGEDEKNVRALFSLAAKVSPTIIFIDEVDSMLGQRSRVEHEAMRKIKNEFMGHWDGLLTKSDATILVLAATNRPFDLDEAIIRRFERRIMVGLPTLESRELILRTLLSKEKVEEGINYNELAISTEGYSGSDLKNLCSTAAYRPVRELLKKETLKELDKKQKSDQKGEETATEKTKEGEAQEITLRPLTMEDFRQAKNQVAASFAAEGSGMGELRQWNELYGEGGSRKKQQLTYFL